MKDLISLMKCAPALQSANIELTTGVKLRYVEQGDPKGQVIIMLHGYSDSWFSYSTILKLISAKYRVYVLDQRGHGDSDCPMSGYTMQNFAADVIAFMNAKGIKGATIVGHSMGSFIAQHVAASVPERVTQLVLCGSATTIRNDVVRNLQSEVNKLKDPVAEEFVREFQEGTFYQPLPDEFKECVIKESLKLPAYVWRDVMTGMLAEDADAQLNSIKTPTLIIWGDKDSIFPRSEQDALVSKIPNAVLKVYEETGHDPHWERPERFVKDLEEFINKPVKQ